MKLMLFSILSEGKLEFKYTVGDDEVRKLADFWVEESKSGRKSIVSHVCSIDLEIIKKLIGIEKLPEVKKKTTIESVRCSMEYFLKDKSCGKARKRLNEIDIRNLDIIINKLKRD